MLVFFSTALCRVAPYVRRRRPLTPGRRRTRPCAVTSTEQGHKSDHRLKLVPLRALMAAAPVNIWTGAPLFGVWVGSRVAASSSEVTMGIVFLIIVVIAVA